MRRAFERIPLPWRTFLLNALVFVAGALAVGGELGTRSAGGGGELRLAVAWRTQ